MQRVHESEIRRVVGMGVVGRVAVLGAGKVGIRHIRAYQQIPGARMTGLFEPHAEQRASAFNEISEETTSYPSFEAVLDDSDVEIVDICSPTPLHFDQVSRSLDAGKTVFCEKPLFAKPAEVHAIIESLKDSDASLRVGYVYRFHPRIQLLKHRLDDGVLGTPRMAVLRIGGRGSHRAWKHGRGSDGGALLDMASHMIDLAHWLFGPVDVIEPLYSGLLMPQREIDGVHVAVDADDVVVLRLRSSSGVEIIVHADFLSSGFANSIEVTGDNGSALVSVISGFPDRYVLKVATTGMDAGESFEPGDSADMLLTELQTFVSDFDEGLVVRETAASLLVAQVVTAFSERDCAP